MKEQLLNDLKEAMKNKDDIKKSTVQLIRASILQFEKDKQIEADNNKILEIITKERKTRLDALADFEKADRQDLIDKTRKEIEILEGYLPKQLSDDELKFEIANIINQVDAHSTSDMGIVMRAAKEKIGSRADGKRISTIVKEYLEAKSKEENI